MIQNYLDFMEIAKKDYKDFVTDATFSIEKLRLDLIDGITIDIRFPVHNKLFFHWMRGNDMFRVDTAPHHPSLESFPRHVHYEREDNAIEDNITGTIDDPISRFTRFMDWVRQGINT
jgi:hypothetical protein